VIEEPTPVGSGRFRDHAQDSSRVLGMSFSSSLLAVKRAVWHTLVGDHDGEEDALLAQLRLPLETSSKRFAAYKRILFSAPHSLPCSSVRGTDVQVASTGMDLRRAYDVLHGLTKLGCEECCRVEMIQQH
jgi:hypothetical protein